MRGSKDRNHPEHLRMFRSQEKNSVSNAISALCFLMERHLIENEVKAQVHKQQKQQHR